MRWGIKLISTLEEGNGNNKDVFDDLASALLDELTGSLGGTTGSNEVVDDEDARVGSKSLLLHLEDVLSVLLLVGSLDALSGKLADLADGDKATAQSLSDSRTKQEASSVKTYDGINLAVAVRLCAGLERGGLCRCGSVVVKRRDGMGEDVRDNVCDQELESQRVTEDGKNVAETNALLGVVVVETCLLAGGASREEWLVSREVADAKACA